MSTTGPEHTAAQPLRIAVVTETYPPEVNGVARTMAELVRGLLARGHAVQVVRPRQSASDRAHAKERYQELLVLGMGVPGYPGVRTGFPSPGLLAKHWRAQRPDLVHIATEGVLGWAALRSARKLGIPVATDFHTNFHSYSGHYGFGLLENVIHGYLRWLHNQARCTMVPTESLCRELAAGGFENLRIVARGVDTDQFNPARRSDELRRAWGVGANDPVVINVGRLAPEKNLQLVLRAFEAMHGVDPRCKLVFVGDGPERQRLQALHPRHVFAGTRVAADLGAHYASADIFLFPSTTETFGNVTLEAMASGLALVGYDYAAAQDHVINWCNGVLVPLGSADAFIASAVELIKRPQQAALMRSRARASAARLSWDAVVESFERELLRLLRGAVTTNELALVSAAAR